MLMPRWSCFRQGFLAAMAQVTGKDIYAYPHRELFGAWGAGLFLRDEIIEARKRIKLFNQHLEDLNL